MSEAKQWQLEKIKRFKEANEAILTDCEVKARDMTDDETVEFKANLARIEEHTIEVKKMEDLEAMKASMDAIGAIGYEAVQEPTIEVKARNIGEAVTTSAEYQTILGEYKRTGSMPRFAMPPIELKATGDPTLLVTATNQDAVQPGWDPTLYTPGLVQFPLRVRELLSQSQASGNLTHYPVVSTRTAPTGNPTVEGAAKKSTEFAFDDAVVTLEKNTAFGSASDELFADAPVLSSYMTNQIGLMVDQVEEASIVVVLYAGITTVTGSGVAASPIGFDAIREAMATIEVDGGVPDGILIHPLDAAFLDTLRATDGQTYYGGGPVGPPRPAWWGDLRIVKSTAADQGRPIVGAFRAGGTVYTRGGTTVETSNAHSDFFEKDKIAIRAYRRSAAVKHYPEFFISCDIGAS